MARYLLVVAPFWALLSASGFEWVFSTLRWKHPLPIAGLLALLPIAGNFYYDQVVPFPAYDNDKLGINFAKWYRNDPISAKYPRIAAVPPQIYFSLDIRPKNDRLIKSYLGKATLQSKDPGTIVIWDSSGTSNADANMCVSDQDLRDAGWIYWKNFSEGSTSVELYLSPLDIDNNPTSIIPAPRFDLWRR